MVQTAYVGGGKREKKSLMGGRYAVYKEFLWD